MIKKIGNIEYVCNSRIDGHPIVKIPKIEKSLFFEYFQNLKDIFNDNIKISSVNNLDEFMNYNYNFDLYKIHIYPDTVFLKECQKFKRKLRLKKLKQLKKINEK